VNPPDLAQALQLGQVTANCSRRDLELAGQLLDANHMVYPQDLAEPLEAFRGEFSWLTGFHFATTNAVLVMLTPLCGRSISVVCLGRRQCLILIDYMTNVLEINQIISPPATPSEAVKESTSAADERRST
jgi:hypothetical protein